MSQVILLTYATEAFRRNQSRLADSAREVGFDEVILCGREALAGTAFAAEHAEILAEPVGAGCWLWKPYLIRQHLEQIGPDDVLVYSDVGRAEGYPFSRFPRTLVEMTRQSEHGYVIGPLLHQHGPLSRWVKRDALILLDADRPEIVQQPTCQATHSCWRATPAAIFLLDSWLAAAQDARIMTDRPNQLGQPNYPDFQAHRHDQAILSVLVQRDRLPVLDVASSGIFRLMALRPTARQTNLYLKSQSNVERVVSGAPFRLDFALNALRDLILPEQLRAS